MYWPAFPEPPVMTMRLDLGGMSDMLGRVRLEVDAYGKKLAGARWTKSGELVGQ